jgi:hypothetical protein
LWGPNRDEMREQLHTSNDPYFDGNNKGPL